MQLKKKRSKELTITSFDTEVFLLLNHYYQSFPHLTYFRTGKGESQHDIDIERCYEEIGVNHT